MSESDIVLDVQGLSHWFGSGETRRQALHGVALTLRRGTFNALVGPAGSGKTTFMTLVGGLREIQDGFIRLFDRNLHSATEAQRTELRRRIGMVLGPETLLKNLTAGQNVMMGLNPDPALPGQTDAQAAHHMLGQLGLSERADLLPARLTESERQRVSIARALVGNRPLVLADEPTSAQDRETARRIVEVMKEVGRARGTTTLVLTRDPDLIGPADSVLNLHDGRLI
jgi:putative ABC transport system ATP-binding protein